MTSGSQGTPPGWYPDPDPQGRGGQRYWDGQQWTEHTSGVQAMPPPVQQRPSHPGGPPPIAGPGQHPPPKKSNTWIWVVAAIVGVLIIVAIASSSSTTDEGDDSSSSQTSSKKSKKKKKNSAKAQANKDAEKPNNASEDYTPHVGPNGKITVDGIVYSVESVEQRESIGDPTIGTAEQASGTYVVVDIAAHSTKGETATLTDGTFKVSYDGGPEYSADTDGTTALTLSGDSGAEPFFLTDIQPDGDERGKVVFDIPDAALGKKLELRVNELGLGPTHGFIRLKV